jgi:hypothetical protein
MYAEGGEVKMEKPIEEGKAIIHKAWKYHLGEWSQIDNPMVWHEGEEHKTALERAGYYPFPQQEYGATLQLYIKKDYTLPYRITFDLGDHLVAVYVYDLPSLMQWLRDYSPIFTLSDIAYLQDETRNLLRRAFRAWHGHVPENVCPSCDPIEYKKRREEDLII